MSMKSYSTMESTAIRYMLKHICEYELVKSRKHDEFKNLREFFKARNICFQNFYKFLGRYKRSGNDVEKLIPIRRGPKPKYVSMPHIDVSEIEEKVLHYRGLGYNKYIISEIIKADSRYKGQSCSASTIYRILKKYGVSKFKPKHKEKAIRYMRDHAGSLLHVESHYLPRGVVQSEQCKRYYVLGVIDDYSRAAWVEVMESVKAIDTAFAMMDSISILYQRYWIKAEEVLTDNGSEFYSPNNKQCHPFERLLMHMLSSIGILVPIGHKLMVK